jgi:hypothetical protein
MIYNDTSLVGFSNLTDCYFTPGFYTLELYKKNLSVTLTTELKQGSNPMVISRLKDEGCLQRRKGVELPQQWFEKDTLHAFAIIAIDNIISLLGESRAATAVIMLVACELNQEESSTQNVHDYRIALVEDMLLSKGVAHSRIKTSKIHVTRGLCKEALYLLVKGLDTVSEFRK